MKHNQLIILTRTAVLAALIAIATMVIPIPIPGGGYANAGDIVMVGEDFAEGEKKDGNEEAEYDNDDGDDEQYR